MLVGTFGPGEHLESQGGRAFILHPARDLTLFDGPRHLLDLVDSRSRTWAYTASDTHIHGHRLSALALAQPSWSSGQVFFRTAHATNRLHARHPGGRGTDKDRGGGRKMTGP